MYIEHRSTVCNAVVTCEIKLVISKLFQVRRRPSEIILFQRVEKCLNYFKRLLQLMTIFQHAQWR